MASITEIVAQIRQAVFGKDVRKNIADGIDAINTEVASHIADYMNPHATTKAQVGLDDVDNTSDLNKPISTATQAALELKVDSRAAQGGGVIGQNANAENGGAVGEYASATSGGAVGSNAKETDGGGAVGQDTSTVNGGAVGYHAVSTYGGAIGYSTTETEGGAAAGNGAFVTSGGAVGFGANAGSGFAGGKNAKTVDGNGVPIDAVQLGSGTNDNPKTMKVYDFILMNSDGKIPIERMPIMQIFVSGEEPITTAESYIWFKTLNQPLSNDMLLNTTAYDNNSEYFINVDTDTETITNAIDDINSAKPDDITIQV